MPPTRLDDLARRPNGLVLITGPTGSGKTTTLNYLIDLINRERRCRSSPSRIPWNSCMRTSAQSSSNRRC